MYYTIYKTTNLINGKIYIGYHSTENPNDDYLGSGKLLNQAIEKNGADKFIKQVLYTFTSKEEALQKERQLVSEDFISRKDTYNIKLGGEGGWDHIGDLDKTPQALLKRSESMKEAIANNKGKSRVMTDEQRMMGANSKPFLGKSHTKDTKRKISQNNGANLGDDVIEQRIQEFNSIEKKRGYITKLAKSWDITGTSVRRFLQKHQLI